MRKTIYISVPITGREEAEISAGVELAKQYIFDNFDASFYLNPLHIRDEVRENFCWESKFKNFEDFKNKFNLKDFSYGLYIGFDLKELIDRADIVLFCKGWQQSKGCRLEHAAAEIYGKEIIYL